MGAEVTCLDLPEAVEGQKPDHRPHAESASAVVNHFHFAHCALPRRAQARQPLRADEAHVAHDHHEREIEQTHEERGFECYAFQLVVRNLNVGVGVYLVAFDYFVGGNLLPRVSIHLQVFDPVAGLLVELVEMDLFGIGCGWVQSDWASHEGKAQKPFPVGAGGHDRSTPERNCELAIQQ